MIELSRRFLGSVARKGVRGRTSECLNVREAGKEREGCPPGVFMQGYDSMGVDGHDRAKDIILKELEIFWKKHIGVGCGAGRPEF